MPVHANEARFELWRARGDAEALAEVFDALAPGLLRLAIHLVGDAAAAEDLVQQTFVTAMERAAGWDARRPLEPWLQGILANHARDLRKSARRAHDPDFDLGAVLARAEDAPLESASRRELSGELARAVDALEEPYRAAVLLRLRHGMEAADIAHVLGRSPGAVRVQLHRARELLKRALPAGIASALVALASPARGLGTVRDQVLEHAARLAPAAGVGGGLLGGVFVMKKVLVAAAVLLLLAAAWWWTERLAEPVAREGNATAVPALVVPRTADAHAGPLAPSREAERGPATAPEPATAAQRVPFPVRVVDGETGLPVAGARLSFYPPKRGTWSELRARWPERFLVDSRGNERVHDWPWFRAQPTARQRLDVDPIVSYEGPLPGETPLATAVSDDEGHAVVELGPEGAFVVAEHPYYATRGMPPELERTVNWSDGKVSHVDTFRDEALVVKLHRPRVLRGQLIDLEGRPLAESVPLRVEGGADGDLLANGWRSHVPSGTWTVWTNPDGSFEAEVGAKRVSVESLDPRWSVARGGWHPVRQEAWRFANVYLLDGLTDGGELAWVPLSRMPTVSVRSALDDAPVRDFRMLVVDLEHDWPRSQVIRVRSEYGWAPLLDGRDFESWSRKVGPLGIHVIAEGFAPGHVECAEPAKAGEIVVRLRPGAAPEVAGTVQDDGRPLAGASVLLAPSNRSNWSCDDEFHRAGLAASTDELGRFAVRAPPGGWVVSVAHGTRSQCRFVEHPASSPLAIDLARDTVVEFQVDAPPGTRFADLFAQLHSGAAVNQGHEIDAQGRARFGSLPAGRYQASVRGPDGALEAVPGDDEFDLGADTTRTLHFRIVPTHGPRHARLVVDGLATLEGWMALASSVGAQPVAVEPDGLVPLDVGRGPARLRIAAPDGTTYLFQVPVESAGEPVLRIARGRAELRGRLVRADGRPQTSRRIAASTRGDEHGLERVETPVDGEGRFRLDALIPGELVLTVAASRGEREYDGLDSVQFACRADAGALGREITIALPMGLDPGVAGSRIALSGLAHGADGPAAGRNLRIAACFDSAEGTLQVVTSTTVLSDGSYALATLPAGRHTASTWFEGGRNWTLEFTLPLDVSAARQDFALR
ncbi:MAG: sigma-70 family RNA polymerase sigma factor [Planctomycetes bacterium]|nr:sigma-70 family RNA polymerase sigma factor [Planctomycetota bacterium]